LARAAIFAALVIVTGRATPAWDADAWHSGGLQAIDIEDPRRPAQTGRLSPAPLPSVAVEDPALGRGPNRSSCGGFPIVRNRLVYVVDIRNRLYVLDYEGRTRPRSTGWACSMATPSQRHAADR
jgi:hypothetical protein